MDEAELRANQSRQTALDEGTPSPEQEGEKICRQGLDNSGNIEGTTKSDGQLTASCLHQPPGPVLCLPASGMSTCAVLTPGEAAAGHIAARHRRCASEAHAFARVRGCRCLVFFSMLANIAAVWAIFFGGLAVTTLRSQKPIRLRTSAMGRGEGNGSSPEPWARQA